MILRLFYYLSEWSCFVVDDPLGSDSCLEILTLTVCFNFPRVHYFPHCTHLSSWSCRHVSDCITIRHVYCALLLNRDVSWSSFLLRPVVRCSSCRSNRQKEFMVERNVYVLPKLVASGQSLEFFHDFQTMEPTFSSVQIPHVRVCFRNEQKVTQFRTSVDIESWRQSCWLIRM